MARKVQISKEVILKNAFEMLLQEGYSAINITSLAKKIGCSTQPIAWHFGNMEGLREDLFVYCLGFLRDNFTIEGDKAADILEGIALRYIKLALDYPQLYKCLYMCELDAEKIMTVAQELRSENQSKVVKIISEEYGLSLEDTEKYMMDIQLYVHGIASYAVTRVSFTSKEVIMQMIHNANEAFLRFYKG